jgi:hypothetical protein
MFLTHPLLNFLVFLIIPFQNEGRGEAALYLGLYKSIIIRNNLAFYSALLFVRAQVSRHFLNRAFSFSCDGFGVKVLIVRFPVER